MAFPNGAGGREGASSLHLLPIERFLSPESTGQGPGFPNQEHLGGERLSRDNEGVALESGNAFGQQRGSLGGPCPWLSPILLPVSKYE